MLRIGGERYEYEINQLLTCTKTHVPIIEHTIETVYLNKNETSHFNTVKVRGGYTKRFLRSFFQALSAGLRIISFCLCSMRYSAALRAVRRSLLSFNLPPKFFALVGARTISSLLNYFLNQRLVFQTKSKGSVLRYYILVAALFVLNYGLLQLMGKIGIALWLAQIIAQLVIYPLSFVIQRKFVFCEKNTTA